MFHIKVLQLEIVTTVDHPFYVKGQGFVNAAELCIGSEFVDNNGNTLLVEQMFLEEMHDETVDVYNFQVEDYHTYFVGGLCILVHNATYPDGVKDLYNQSNPGRKTNGKTEQRIFDGDFENTMSDFESLNPHNVRNIDTPWGEGKVGQIEGDYVAVARPGSTDGRSTLEIQNRCNQRKLKFRYEGGRE